MSHTPPHGTHISLPNKTRRDAACSHAHTTDPILPAIRIDQSLIPLSLQRGPCPSAPPPPSRLSHLVLMRECYTVHRLAIRIPIRCVGRLRKHKYGNTILRPIVKHPKMPLRPYSRPASDIRIPPLNPPPQFPPTSPCYVIRLRRQ